MASEQLLCRLDSFSSCQANYMQSVVIHVPSCRMYEDLGCKATYGPLDGDYMLQYMHVVTDIHTEAGSLLGGGAYDQSSKQPA